MKIVVCVKQVPGVASVKIDPETKRLVREGVVSVVNPFDYAALEEALRIREREGGEVVVLTMGPPKAEAALREALACGADRAVLLSDRRFGGSDTWGTSYVLARAIEKIGGVDLVLCGKQAIDGDTAQVGPGIAAHLGWTQAAGVVGIRSSSAAAFEVVRMRETGTDRCRMRLPAVLAVAREINEPRVPGLRGWRKATEAAIVVWDADAIAASPELLGLKGSPTRVVSTSVPEHRQKNTKWLRCGPSDNARALLSELRQLAAL